MKRRAVLGAMLALGLADRASAQAYPTRPIKLVVPFTPGGVTDNIARVFCERMGRELGQQFIIDNRAGANGRIGTDAVAKSAPDGYTLLLGGIGALTIHPHMLKVPYDPVNDFIPISLIATNDVVIVINPKLSPRTPAELIAYLKANPGKLQYGSSGIGAPTHLAAELFKSRIGADMIHVPYKGDSAAVMDVVSGTVDMSFSTVSATISLIRGGKLRPIAMTGLVRSQSLPDVPTLGESGIPGFDLSSWWGIVGPAGMPPEVVNTLNAAINKTLNSPEIGKFMASEGAEAQAMTPQQFSDLIHTEIQRWTKVGHDANISID